MSDRVGKNRESIGLAHGLAAGPRWVLSMIEVPIGMRHQPEDTACGIANAGDSQYRAIGVGRVLIVVALPIHITQGNLSAVEQSASHGLGSGQHLAFRVLDGKLKD